ncbi:hypothetical protein CAPTEDRAFT_212106 [Capitella teleta]|uniref:Uncharacterized protein n=1 Tax=Capitella teleta TaxID=283909 RepID=R7V7P2_CAPTE|nr:hypothetical protein CAPTEDRAFT_212106 [Capitella teleta]|eukprot:ELU12396.1 hypothetical protein CAPTEDRAFT_212106 [Capitella teleta]
MFRKGLRKLEATLWYTQDHLKKRVDVPHAIETLCVYSAPINTTEKLHSEINWPTRLKHLATCKLDNASEPIGTVKQSIENDKRTARPAVCIMFMRYLRPLSSGDDLAPRLRDVHSATIL